MRNKNVIKKSIGIKNGFTLIELIVVISVIGILASIVIVSYGSWKQSTTKAQLKSDLSGVAAAMENARTFGNIYPTTIPSTFVPSNGVTLSGGGLNSGKGYCVDAKNGDQSYNISSQYSTPTIGPCSVLYLDAGIAASYPGSGTTLTDLSGNGNNGTLVGGFGVNGLGYSSTNGGSLTFDGVDDYVSEYSIPDSFWNSGSWTVSTWVSFNTVDKGSDNVIIGHGSASTNNGLHLCERYTRVYFGFYGNDMASNTTLSAGTWYNLIFTFNNSSKLKQIYVNGVFDNSGGAVGYGGAGSNTEIGRYPWSTTSLMYGKIAGTRLYNSVLPASEIQQNFNALHGRYGA